MKRIEAAKQLILAEKLKHYNERLADIERDLDFFYKESIDDEESLKVIQDLKKNVERLKIIKNREKQETVV
ncbi:hypothetical protein B481_1449 [Planococcus halocryophilus Or1]|uniref:Uncharacterized protein n=1 Tax=Planococcus halocryophilus TaxID=1215089 RepID=A0A1C7DUF9_9BACL|nr:hypothetical protein [Planococcus halocryophilus]ANU15146.1 hypothetical protein BBI08_15400 [Planococcus halocryophilus]EMF47053.1 hypothetical protein B481_1449 [Planococcus halocryophilus Or1]